MSIIFDLSVLFSGIFIHASSLLILCYGSSSDVSLYLSYNTISSLFVLKKKDNSMPSKLYRSSKNEVSFRCREVALVGDPRCCDPCHAGLIEGLMYDLRFNIVGSGNLV